MTDLMWFIYLAGLMGDVKGLIFLSVVLFMFGAVSVFVSIDRDFQDIREPMVRNGKTCLKVAFFMFIFCWLLPSERTMYLMLGAKVGQEVMVSDAGKKVQDILIQKLDEFSETVTKEVTK